MGKGPGRIRVKGPGGKYKKRWKKGQSCVTNPTVKKHRQNASSSRTFTPNRTFLGAKSGGLTEAALARHDGDEREGAATAESVGGETFGTFLTGVSDCSQPAFSKIKRFWQSQSASQKEVCAVLAAVTEVIRDQGGKETETEYFGALMSAIETMHQEESLTAVVFLLSLIIKRVPAPVLKLKFSEVSKTIMDILARHSRGGNTALVKSTLTCMGHLLRAQDLLAWSHASTLNTFQGVLGFTIHSKPKVRKASQNAIISVLNGSQFMLDDRAPSSHPAAQSTSKFCIQQIEKHGGSAEASTTCHVLTLLQSVVATFSKSCLKDTCETILKVMTLSNVVITAVAMKALHSLFVHAPKIEDLPEDLNARLINALYDFQPAANDVQPSQAWLAVMQAAHINLFKNAETLCLDHLHRLFQVCMGFLLSDKGEIAVSSANVMKTVLHDCLGSASGQKTVIHGKQNPIVKIFLQVEGGMSYRYHASWGLVLQVLGAFFAVWGKEGHQYMKKCLQTICDLRITHHFAYVNEVDKCMAEAIKTMGPSLVLDAVPLHITGEEDNYDFPRSWLMPVIRDNVCNTELQFFTKYFLPLAGKLKVKSLELKQKGRDVEAKTYETLQSQIWSLLPGFCKGPTDLVPAFKGVAKILGSAMSDCPDLRPDICAGLRNIIKCNLDNDENRTELARFAKNYLPIFFNIYTTGGSKDRSILTVLETIKVYLQITDVKLVDDLATRVCGKLQSPDTDQHPALIDLMIAVVPHAGSKKLAQIFKTVVPHFESLDHTLQKKSYRVLEEICSGESEACGRFLEENVEELQKKLVASMSASSPPSKPPRLRCLLHIVKRLPAGKEDFLRDILPEVILCTKEVNAKARGSAFLLLVETGKYLMRSDEENERREAMAQYLNMLAAGLAGSPQMVSATILAFTRVVYEFKDLMEGELLEQLLTSVHNLLRSKSREILRSSLGLVKVLLSVIEDVSMAQFVEPLIEDLGGLSDANSRALRVSVKSIYKKMIQKFGYEMIFKMVPDRHQKMLHNVKKQQDRRKRSRAVRDALDSKEDGEGDGADEALAPSKPKPESLEEILRESDSEDDEEGQAQAKNRKDKGQRAKRSTWLKEDVQDEPLDFLDANVSKRVLATKPTKDAAAHTGIRHDFKKLPDGRLVITEPAEDETRGGPSSGARKRKLEPVDDLEEMMDKELSSARKKTKRKWDDIDTSDDEVSSKYQAGGGGIHRNVSGAKKVKKMGEDYKSKKAGGDIKKKGRPDPFAYVPMSRLQLNKRQKKKSSGMWKGVVKSGHRDPETQPTKRKGRKTQTNKKHKKR